MVKIHPSWHQQLQSEFEKPYYKELSESVREAYLSTSVHPPPRLVFNAFDLCPFDDTKVVIMGQDPYHGPGQAHGLAFSVADGVRTPPSLQNIYKEIAADTGTPIPESGNLEHWSTQGVLLLNATLTVESGRPNSHQKFGWGTFTNAVIKKVSNEQSNVVFLLWGKFAQEKATLIDAKKHCILKSPHPSPFSAHTGFLGCKHFSKTNKYLEKHGKSPIIW